MPHANRGNVAIIAWNTLTAPYVWDVTNTEYEGTINLGNSTRSLLGIYFRDYVHMVEGRYNTTEVIKEAEDLTVAAVPSTDRKLKERQIKLVDEGDEGGWDKFADAFSTNSKEDTYRVAKKTVDGDIEPEHVIATVPEEVYKNLDNLQGKKVTVLFGEDNTVALIIVTNDGVVDGEFVDKYDSDDKEITIAGTKYEFAKEPEAYVNNSKEKFAMTKILSELGEEDGKDFTKRVKANVLLDDEGDIERLDLYVSGTYKNFATVEGIVTKVKGEKITYYTHSTDGKLNTKNVYDYSEIKAKELPVVNKDGEIVSLEDIAVNDVITLCYDKNVNNVLSIYASSTKLDGEVTRTKNADNSVYVDGTKYVSSMNGVAVWTSDDVEDNNKCEIGKDVEKGDTISAFLNIYGEYVLIATDDANDGAWTFAIVRGIKNVDENDDEELVATLKLLMADGSKSNAYKVVADVDDYVIQVPGNRDKEADFEDVLEDYIGKLVAFKANADMEIVLDLDGMTSSNFEDFAEEDLVVVAYTLSDDIAKNSSLPIDFTNDYEVTEAKNAEADKDYKTITYSDGKEYVKDFEDTKIFDMKDQEVSEKWNAMVNGDALVGKAVVICEKGKAGIKYIAFMTTDAATSDSIYARLLEVFSDVVSLFDGNEKVEYEHKDMENTIKSYAKNSFVEYETNSKNEVSKMNLLVDVDEFEDTNYDEIIAAGVLNSGNETKLAVAHNALNQEIKVTAAVTEGAYRNHADFATGASAALQVYTINHVLPVNASNGDKYTIVQKNAALSIAYPSDGYFGTSGTHKDVKVSTWTVGENKITADEELNLLLSATNIATVEVYEGEIEYANLGTNADKLVATYKITPTITTAPAIENESLDIKVEKDNNLVKDNFKVEKIYTNRFEYDTVEDVTLDTIRIDKEDTTIYVMESNGTYTVSKDFSTIEVGSYVIPFKTSECDPKANANILVVID